MGIKKKKKAGKVIKYIDYIGGCEPEVLDVITQPKELDGKPEVTEIRGRYGSMTTTESHSDKEFHFKFLKGKPVTLTWGQAETIMTYMRIFHAESPNWNDQSQFLARKID